MTVWTQHGQKWTEPELPDHWEFSAKRRRHMQLKNRRYQQGSLRATDNHRLKMMLRA